MGRCPLTFVSGHATMGKDVSGFWIKVHPLSGRWSSLRIIDLLCL